MESTKIHSILGITEKELVKLTSKEKEKYVKEINNKLFFENQINKKLIPIGSIEIYNIEELKYVLDIEYLQEIPMKQINILKNTDIADLQTTFKKDKKVLVQVASNFNCLELPGMYYNKDCGSYVEDIDIDTSQGPAACMGPLAATLYRTHFYPEIDLLSEVHEYLGETRNGKILYTNRKEIINIDEVVKKIKICIHSDISVLFGRRGKISGTMYPVMDQCFTSSINTKYIDKIRTLADKQKLLMRTCLRAVYEGTYLAAISRKRKNLYLTLVGAGCFGNDLDIIIDELMNAHKKYGYYIDNVFLCQYDNTNEIKNKIQTYYD